jgi:hypothetical protein
VQVLKEWNNSQSGCLEYDGVFALAVTSLRPACASAPTACRCLRVAARIQLGWGCLYLWCPLSFACALSAGVYRKGSCVHVDPERSFPMLLAEVVQWLCDISSATETAGNPFGGVTEDEVQYIIMEANRDNYDNHGDSVTFPALKSKTIRPEDFGIAMDAWMEYRECQGSIQAIMLKFDLDGDKVLNKQELSAFLTDLNELVPVSDSNTANIIEESDYLGHGHIVPINLPKAIATFYELERRKQEDLKSKSMLNVVTKSLKKVVRPQEETPQGQTETERSKGCVTS